jgi:hypothetical protein
MTKRNTIMLKIPAHLVSSWPLLLETQGMQCTLGKIALGKWDEKYRSATVSGGGFVVFVYSSSGPADRDSGGHVYFGPDGRPVPKFDIILIQFDSISNLERNDQLIRFVESIKANLLLKGAEEIKSVIRSPG